MRYLMLLFTCLLFVGCGGTQQTVSTEGVEIINHSYFYAHAHFSDGSVVQSEIRAGTSEKAKKEMERMHPGATTYCASLTPMLSGH